MNSNIPFQIFESQILNEKYKLYKHPSGLDVYVFNKKMSTSYGMLGVKYGSVHNKFFSDKNGDITTIPDGVAHFLEHKMFSNQDGSDSFERFSDYGADANAYTSFNRTAYLFSCTDNFENCLEELIDFVTHPYFTKENVDKEKGIIAEEIKMYDDSPGDRCYYGMLEGMYEKHSIQRNICGSIESISKITPDILYRCYDMFYALSNMVLIVCGDVTDKTVMDIVNKKLENLSSNFSVPVKINENDFESPNVFKSYVEQRMQVSKPLFSIGFKDTAIPKDSWKRQKKDAIMAILDEMLFSRAGELYNLLIDKNMISPNFSYGYTISEYAAYNSLSGECNDPKAVFDTVMKYLKSIDKDMLDRNKFEIGRRVMYAEFVKSFDSTDSIANNLLSFACEESEILSYADIISSVSLDDVVEAFEKSFNENTAVLSVVLPI